MNLKVVFFGTPVFAETVLHDLIKLGVHICAVVTRQDRAQKRSSKLMPSAVKTIALTYNIPVIQPSKASDESFIEELKSLGADVFIVVAYGAILKQCVLDIPALGCYNLHAGLLPAFRGAAPIQRCIMAQHTISGNTVIRMDAGMDTGDIVRTTRVPITQDLTAGDLAEALARQGGEVLFQTLKDIESNQIVFSPQDNSQASLAPKLTKEEGRIAWDQEVSKVYAHIRGVTPKPGAWTMMDYDGIQKRLLIKKARLAEDHLDAPAGTLIINNKSAFITCLNGSAISLLEVQIEGKQTMYIQDFINGINKSKDLKIF